MAGVLLDTHALYWLVSGAQDLSEAALLAIGEAQDAGALLLSPITAWELAISVQKPRHADRPHLGEVTPAAWFREATRATGARIVGVRHRISLGAAEVAARTGHKDPGDCFLIATARARHVPLVTRDATIHKIAQDHPGYLQIVAC